MAVEYDDIVGSGGSSDGGSGNTALALVGGR